MLTYVLIHGAGSTRQAWNPVTAHLRHPFLAVDLPGRNDKPGDLDTLTVRDFAASVVDDMDAQGIGSAVIVGHSLAGLTLVTLAGLIPERIAHLVFVNSVVPPDTQRHSIANLTGCGCPVNVIGIEAGHMVTRSRPEELARLLDAVDPAGMAAS